MRNRMKIVKNEDGQVLIMVAFLMVVLIGIAALVLDVGNLYLTKSKLQNAADAAALAGARDLPAADAARSTATTYAQNNGVKGAGDIVTVTPSYDDDPDKIKVVCKRTVQNSFAGVLGFDQADVSAYAVALRGSSEGVSGLRPWALKDNYTYTYGLEFELKEGGGGGSNGYYGVISFGTQGGDANTYKGNIEYGYNGTVEIGDFVNDAPGNMNVKKVINDLMDKSGDTSRDYTKAKEGNSRVVLVPKIDSSFEVIGFAVLYLVSVDNQGYITANFLYDTTWSKEEQTKHYDWGLNSRAKLIE